MRQCEMKHIARFGKVWFQVCWRQMKTCAGVIKKPMWRKETWWWHAAVDSTVEEKWTCWKTWQKGGSKEEHQKAKQQAKHAVYLTKYQAKQEFLKDPSPSSSDLFCLANQIRLGNLDVVVEKSLRDAAGNKLWLNGMAKGAAWKEHY